MQRPVGMEGTNLGVLFRNGFLMDGLGGSVEGGDILVEGERIAAVGRGLEGRRGPDTRVVDLAGRSILPGLIDAHVHTGGDFFPGNLQENLAMACFRTADAARRTLLAGVTTVRTAGSREFLDVDLRDAINAGLIVGPRVVASGRGLTTTGGHEHEMCMEVDGVDAVVNAVRYHMKRRCDSIKLMMSAGVATRGPHVASAMFNLDEAKAAVFEAHKYGMKVLTHSFGVEAILNGIEAGVDSIDHGSWLNEELATMMKERGIYLIPTFGPGYYYTQIRKAEPWRIARSEQVTPVRIEAFHVALEIGVPVAMGSDCGGPSRFPNGENLLEMELMVKYGMKSEDVVKASTSETAKAIGLFHHIGSLEPGKLADLVVVEGNPIDDMGVMRRGVKLVMKGGNIYRDELAR
ncbi:MAG: amidohydrolase family protein [Armatimonadetes bacterium]|nr:amidohydrolase family protein [Armatimonadota bacterium]